MATVRPRSLPAASSVASSDAFIVDNGATVEKATPGQIVDAAIPLASQAEAEAGADNVKRVTPLRVKQAMDANMATTDALASTAAGKGAALVNFLQSGTGAVARTAQAKMRDFVNVLDFHTTGTIGVDAALDTAALNAALDTGKSVRLPQGALSYTPSAKALVFGQYIIADSPLLSTINKVANGDMFTMAAGSGMVNVGLQGNGGSGGTGRGLLIPVNTADIALINCNILDMDGYCIEVTAPQGGSQLRIIGGLYARTDTSLCAIRLPDDGTTATPRSLIGVDSTGNLIDLNAAQNTLLSGCYFRGLLFGTAKKSLISGCRLATIGATTTITGTENIVTGCAIAGNVVVDVGATGCAFDSSNVIASGYTVTDNSGDTSNKVDIPRTVYTPTWTTSGTAPAIGNGSLAAHYTRKGLRVSNHIEAVFGSTSTFGTGEFRFSVPFANNGTYSAVGSALINIGGTLFVGNAQVPAGASYARLHVTNTSNYVSDGNPAAFASGAYIILDFEYEM